MKSAKKNIILHLYVSLLLSIFDDILIKTNRCNHIQREKENLSLVVHSIRQGKIYHL
jgi:hypothetical protein